MANKKTDDKKKYDFSDLSIEDGLKQLDEITGAMQDPELPLEKTFELYEKGTALLAYVNGRVEAVEAQVRVLKGDGSTAPFGSGSGEGDGGEGAGGAGDAAGFYGDDELPFA